ncbi:hypothetical protein CXF38_01685 [Corynebacterium bovis]|nr:hypothetical protein CXF38_01685 [Corynebacterium bovis]
MSATVTAWLTRTVGGAVGGGAGGRADAEEVPQLVGHGQPELGRRGGVPVGPVGAVGVRRAQEERRRVAAVRDEPELLHRAPPGVGYVGDGPPVGSTVSP